MVDVAVIESGGTDGEESSASAVSWGAIIAGGVISAAVAFLLFILGAGLGLSTASMWTTQTATALGVGTIIWLIITQWIAGGLGGYITGRLRTKWVRVHNDEIFFRDTAHGFAAWALGVVVSMTILAWGAASVISGVGSAATSVASGVAQGATQGAAQGGLQALASPNAYLLDTLFRPAAAAAGAAATPPASGGAATAPAAGATPAPPAAPSGTAPATPPAATSETPPAATPAAGVRTRSPQEIRAEAGRIFIRSLGGTEAMPAADKTYLAQLISGQTGMSQADAEKRIDDVTAQAKAAADKAKQVADDARKATAALALFTFLSLLVGAFISSAAAAFGGNQRDENEALYLSNR